MKKVAEKRTKRTVNKKELFLKKLLLSLGNVSRACKLSKTGRTTFYEWKEDSEFLCAYNDVLEEVVEMAESELFRRGVKGVRKPIFQGKKLVGHVQEYSDTCLIFLLKALKPEKYTQVQKIAPTDPTGQEPWKIEVVYDSAVKADFGIAE